MRKLAVVMAVLALAGCENEVEGVHKQVAEHLHNPKTAKFGNVRIDTQGTICGQVRGKDDAGQYEAYRSYVAIKRDGQYDIIVDDTGNNLRIRELCGGADLQRRAEEVPVAAYVVVIALMAAQALGRANVRRDPASVWVAVGACFFMLSDTLLALNRFVTPLPMAQLGVLTTYYAAQCLMVGGLIRSRPV